MTFPIHSRRLICRALLLLALAVVPRHAHAVPINENIGYDELNGLRETRHSYLQKPVSLYTVLKQLRVFGTPYGEVRPERAAILHGFVESCFLPGREPQAAFDLLTAERLSPEDREEITTHIYYLSSTPQAAYPPDPALPLSAPSGDLLGRVAAYQLQLINDKAATLSAERKYDSASPRQHYYEATITRLYEPLPFLTWELFPRVPYANGYLRWRLLSRMLRANPAAAEGVISRAGSDQLEALACTYSYPYGSSTPQLFGQIPSSQRDLVGRLLYTASMDCQRPDLALRWIPLFRDPLLRQIAMDRIPDPILRRLALIPVPAGLQSHIEIEEQPAAPVPALDRIAELGDDELIRLYPLIAELPYDARELDLLPYITVQLARHGKTETADDLVLALPKMGENDNYHKYYGNSDRGKQLLFIYANGRLSPERLLARLSRHPDKHHDILTGYTWHCLSTAGNPEDLFTVYSSLDPGSADPGLVIGIIVDSFDKMAFTQFTADKPPLAHPAPEVLKRMSAIIEDFIDRGVTPPDLANPLYSSLLAETLPDIAWKLQSRQSSPDPASSGIALACLLKEDPEKAFALLTQASRPLVTALLTVRVFNSYTADGKRSSPIIHDPLSRVPWENRNLVHVALASSALRNDCLNLACDAAARINDPILRSITLERIPDPLLRAHVPPLPVFYAEGYLRSSPRTPRIPYTR